MPRQTDIRAAFFTAIQMNPNGYKYLHTDDFINALRARNWYFTQHDGCFSECFDCRVWDYLRI